MADDLKARLQIEWDRQGAYNACKLCDNSPDKGLTCHAEGWQPAAQARGLTGCCGPDARLLSFPGLESAGERIRAIYAHAQGINP
jgi:hypothetical protein